jgi:hypothetical protein
MKNLTQIAKEYIKSGLSILPVKNDKTPASLHWKDADIIFKESDFERVEALGIKGGKGSNNLEIIDFDNHFFDAKKIISEFINILEVKEIYEKYSLPIESSQSGGFHLFYRCDIIEGNQKLASRPRWDEKTNKFKPDCIIETRGEGGYVVSAPSDNYIVIRNSLTNIACIEQEERKILLTHAKSFNQFIQNVKSDVNENKDKPGDYYNEQLEAIEEMKGSLKRHGWHEINSHLWRREGKSKGISATIGKVAPNVFYCFTSNGYPFEPESGYKPFQVVGLLDYNGDFSKFAKDLAERYNLNKKPEYTKPAEKHEEKSNYETILNKSFIDLTIVPPKPPIILEISDDKGDGHEWQRLFTLGNFSVITGKAKSKKTFSTTMPMAALIQNGIVYNKFRATLPTGKNIIVKFDTEQGRYDAYIASKRIEKLIGSDGWTNFKTYGLREFSPVERCEIIDFAIKKYSDSIAFVLIDGIADLVNSINDEAEAMKVGGLLMKWTEIYNIHICNIIHQNKNDNYATGHIGSFVLKKAETIISVEKDEMSKRRSIVSCDMIRGVDSFEPFGFEINEKGLPELYKLIHKVEESKFPWEKPDARIEPTLNEMKSNEIEWTKSDQSPF